MVRWWKSAVNFSFLLCLAACRMRSSACDRLSRSCARRVLCWPAFPSAPALGSAGSDPDRSASFVGLAATMAGSDFSCPFIAGYGSSPSRRDPATLARPGWARDLPVPAQGASAHARVSDHAGLPERSRWRARSCCLPLWVQRRRPGLFSFRGSMAGLRPPLPTLRRRPPGALTRVAARTRAPSPIRDRHHRRLQPFRHLHDCSGCFRLERPPGGTCTHWKAQPSHGARKERSCGSHRPKATFAVSNGA